MAVARELRSQPAWITLLMIAANVALLVAMVVGGASPLMPDANRMIEWGANYGPRTMAGEWWRLVSNTFLHFGVVHLALNMWVLWVVGRMVERLVGHFGFLLMYVAAGVLGSLASLIWDPVVVSAGASSSVFGVVGALFGFLAPRRDSMPLHVLKKFRSSVVTFLVVNLLFGISIPGIDNAAHVGGFAGGLLSGWLLSQPLTPELHRMRWRRNAGLVAVMTVVIGGVLLAMPPAPADVAAEMELVEQEHDRLIDVYNDLIGAWQRGQLTDEACADSVAAQVLVPWRDLRGEVGSLAEEPGANREFIVPFVEYLSLREQSWELMVDALRKRDPILLGQYLMKFRAADKALDELLGDDEDAAADADDKP
ncbi:rhomboid family intramembrane serine protease [Maioricimonas rarisocia]|uniref:rhomboid family intramembrane serine protease n=1 Tax=Maioricimonas rarisocia TaxID=2528026 RepID=UPI0018D26D94|nr:rhomboid family intramembrane serine protease [Maioricimonas rarisocia]